MKRTQLPIRQKHSHNVNDHKDNETNFNGK